MCLVDFAAKVGDRGGRMIFSRLRPRVKMGVAPGRRQKEAQLPKQRSKDLEDKDRGEGLDQL